RSRKTWSVFTSSMSIGQPILELMKSIIIALVLGFATLLAAQQTAFDVVSVKRSTNANGMSVSSTGGRFRATGATVVSLILNAYPDFHSFQIVGAPSWAQTDGYDVEGRS